MGRIRCCFFTPYPDALTSSASATQTALSIEKAVVHRSDSLPDGTRFFIHWQSMHVCRNGLLIVLTWGKLSLYCRELMLVHVSCPYRKSVKKRLVAYAPESYRPPNRGATETT